MTPEERAEKVYAACLPWDKPNQIRLIAAEIREAVEEAVRVPCLSAECGLQAFAEGKRFAYEKAAKIAEMYLIHDPDDGQHGGFIANAIRALAAEEK